MLQKFFRRGTDHLDPLALSLTALGRIALFDAPLTPELMRSPYLRSRIADPEQRRLPDEFVPSLKTYYPKNYGIHRVIDALKERLARDNVSIPAETQVVGIGRADNRVTNVTIDRNGERRTFDGVADLFWSAGPQFVAPLLTEKFSAVAFERGPRTVVVNLLLDREPEMSGIYYFIATSPALTRSG